MTIIIIYDHYDYQSGDTYNGITVGRFDAVRVVIAIIPFPFFWFFNKQPVSFLGSAGVLLFDDYFLPAVIS